MSGPVPRESYLAAHAEVDIILDTFPFTGGTTTCEALWMGVPTLTLAGDTMLARQGASLLTCAGLTDWVADSEEDYMNRAIRHATNLSSLAELLDYGSKCCIAHYSMLLVLRGIWKMHCWICGSNGAVGYERGNV
ncbi:MAG: hypothetical protein HY306_05410 [Nitrosomonadales bacterium]|nr:hypothetical protein [Nitrosomonadales bacterium]